MTMTKKDEATYRFSLFVVFPEKMVSPISKVGLLLRKIDLRVSNERRRREDEPTSQISSGNGAGV